MPFTEVRVKAGWDQNPLATTDRIEEYTPASGEQVSLSTFGKVYAAVGAMPNYSRGQSRFDADGVRSFAGRKQVEYVSPRVHRDTVDNLITDLEGQVTAYLTDYGTTYAYYNCYLYLDFTPATLGNDQNENWGSLRWTFSIVEAL